MTLIKARRATIEFSPEVKIDCYELPDGEFRIGLSGASVALGYTKHWLGKISQVAQNPTKRLRTLQAMGFTGSIKSIEIAERENGIRGASRANTISLDDFGVLIDYAIASGKRDAIALNSALRKVGLTDWARLAFGYDHLTLEEKRSLFHREYARTINWLEEDKKDVAVIENAIAYWSAA